MRAARFSTAPVLAALLAASLVLLAACATTARPSAFRTFLLPPKHGPVTPQEAPAEPPRLQNDLYANETPLHGDTIPQIKRPTDAEFLIKKAEDRFAAGKRAFQDGKLDESRDEFNKAIEILLGAPENLPDRTRVERRLEELADGIYRYDLDRLNAGQPADQIPPFDKAPRDTPPDLTFPVDPSLRSKVKEQIAATASQLPLEVNDAVLTYVSYFSSERGKRSLAAGIRRSGRYKDIIEKALREEGIPQELIFLSQAESAFLPRAVSVKACVGLWQFAQFRGIEYGLMQTSATEDRMDPVKASRAAARHLHDLYQHFGDWYLAMAAYDCGPGCVDRAIMRTGYADFFMLRKLNVLPKETANYVPTILGMIIVAKNAKDYGLELPSYDPPMHFDTIELQTPTHIALVAEAVDRPLSELKDLNPALLRSVAPAGYGMHVPKGTLEALERAFEVVPPNRRDTWRLHRVESSDTFAALAKRYKSDTLTVASANQESLPEPGAWAAIPVSYPGERVVARPGAKPAVSARKKPGAPVRSSATRSNAPRSGTATRTGTAPRNTAAARRTTVAQKSPVRSASAKPARSSL